MFQRVRQVAAAVSTLFGQVCQMVAPGIKLLSMTAGLSVTVLQQY